VKFTSFLQSVFPRGLSIYPISGIVPVLHAPAALLARIQAVKPPGEIEEEFGSAPGSRKVRAE
jgi:hypothetical protein